MTKQNDDKLRVLSDLSMFSADDLAGSEPSRQKLMSSAAKRLLDNEGDADDAGDEQAARPGQPTQRADVAERAAELAAREVPADEDEDPRSPCARARERTKEMVRHGVAAHALIQELIAALGRSSPVAWGLPHLTEKADDLAEAWIDILGS